MPGKGGDHDLKFGFQYLYARNDLYEQGSMNGVFTFPGDRAFNAADPSTYPERLSIRVPIPAGVTSFTHSFAYLRAGQVASDAEADPQPRPALRRRHLSVPSAAAIRCSRAGQYPVDKNNFQPRVGFAYNLDGRSVIRGGVGRYYEKFFIGQGSPLQDTGVFGDRSSSIFPSAQPTRARAMGGFRPIRCSSTARS